MLISLLYLAIGILLTICSLLGYRLWTTERQHTENLQNAHKSLLSAANKIQAIESRVDHLETRLGAMEARKAAFSNPNQNPFTQRAW